MHKTQNFNISKHWLYWWFEILITDGFIKHQNCLSWFKLLLWFPLSLQNVSSNSRGKQMLNERRGVKECSLLVLWVVLFYCCVVPGKRKFRGPKEITDEGIKMGTSASKALLHKYTWHKRLFQSKLSCYMASIILEENCHALEDLP